MAKIRPKPVDNSNYTVENSSALGITCDSILSKFIQFSPYMGGIKTITGIFGLTVISSSGIELNADQFIPARIHKQLIFTEGPHKPQIPSPGSFPPKYAGGGIVIHKSTSPTKTTNINYNEG